MLTQTLIKNSTLSTHVVQSFSGGCKTSPASR